MLRIKELRKRESTTQQELANYIGVARSTIAMWESGHTQPDNNALIELADYFHVSVDYLVGRTNDPIDYEDGDLIASVAGPILDNFNGNVRKAVAFQDVVAEDAKAESDARAAPASSLREKYGILPGMDVDEIVEVFHKNPKLGVLFSRSANLSDKDIDFMLEMLDRMNPDDD